MATASKTITFSAQAGTQTQANAKLKAEFVDALSFRLLEVNEALRLEGRPPVTVADIAGASNAQLDRLVTLVENTAFTRDAKSYRAKVAADALLAAPPNLDPVP